MLEASPLVEVAGTARDGEEALRKVFELEPDLVTLDLEMPRMDGFTFLRLLLARRPTPVVVVSGRAGHEDVFRALELGAVDFVAKPTARAGPELGGIQQELIRKVHAIRELRIEKVRDRLAAPPAKLAPRDAQPPAHAVVAIGSSTGGPAALLRIFGAFAEAPACAFLVSQHMPAGFTSGFAQRLAQKTALAAREARGGESPEPGCILVAPGGAHLELESAGGRVRTRIAPRRTCDKYAPSVDRLFESAARHFGADLLAVVLTGMGDDGRRGVQAVKACGGFVVAESEESAVIFGMPKQAIRTGAVDQVVPLGEIAGLIQDGTRCARRGWGRKLA
jgi:two-component system chemotaxis response regulator CheB